MKRHHARTPLLIVLLIAGVTFGVTSWLATHAAGISIGTLEQLVAVSLVAGVGGLRILR